MLARKYRIHCCSSFIMKCCVGWLMTLAVTTVAGWADIQADFSHCHSTRHVPGGTPPCSACARASFSSPARTGPHRVPPPPRIIYLSCRRLLPIWIHQGTFGISLWNQYLLHDQNFPNCTLNIQHIISGRNYCIISIGFSKFGLTLL